MGAINESAIWEASIYQIEPGDPVMGGENGIPNRPNKQLANRTQWLKSVYSVGHNQDGTHKVENLKTNLTNVITNNEIAANAAILETKIDFTFVDELRINNSATYAVTKDITDDLRTTYTLASGKVDHGTVLYTDRVNPGTYAPTDPTHPATKAYVDSQASAINHGTLSSILGANTASTDETKNKHVSDSQARKWELKANETAQDMLDKLKTVLGSGADLDANSVGGFTATKLATPDTLVVRDDAGGITITGITLTGGLVSQRADTVFYSADTEEVHKVSRADYQKSLFVYAPKEVNFTAAAGQIYMVNGGITVTLPASPVEGDTVKLIPRSNWYINPITIARNGINICEIAENFVIDRYCAITLSFSGNETIGWILN